MKVLLGVFLLWLGALTVFSADVISFDANGGAGMMNDKSVKGTPRYVKLPPCRYVRSGYRFVGWCGMCEACDEDSTCFHKEGESVLVTRDTTYLAMWRKLWLPHPTNYCAYVIDDSGRTAAILLAKAGKPNGKSGISKIAVTVFPAGGRRVSLKGTTDTGDLVISNRVVSLRLQLSEVGLAGTLNGLSVYGAPVVPTWGRASSTYVPLTQRAPYAYLSSSMQLSSTYWFNAFSPTVTVCETCWLYLPENVEVMVVGTTWKTLSKDRLKLVDGALDPCGVSVNPCGVKLSYRNTTGCFSGTFSSYQSVGDKVGLYAKDKYSVIGVVVDGVGYGYATSKSGNLCEVSLTR